MKLADVLSRFLAFLQENELLGAVADKTALDNHLLLDCRRTSSRGCIV